MLPSEKAAVLALRYSKMICQGRRNDIIEELKGWKTLMKSGKTRLVALTATSPKAGMLWGLSTT